MTVCRFSDVSRPHSVGEVLLLESSRVAVPPTSELLRSSSKCARVTAVV